MSAPKIRIDYDQVGQIERLFGGESGQCLAMLRALKKEVDTLRGGNWIGPGATAFYAEMDGSVFPALQRLASSLERAATDTRRINLLFQAAEADAAAVLRALLGGAAQPGGAGLPAGAGGFAGVGAGASAKVGFSDAFSPLTWALGKSAGLFWRAFKDRYAIQSMVTALRNGGGFVRFAKDANGFFRAFGSQAAKEALGLPRNLTRFGANYVASKNAPFGAGVKNIWGAIKSVVAGDGPFAARARDALKYLRTPALEAAMPYGKRFMANFKGSAFVSAGISVVQNLWSYGFGDKSNLGLGSRQFITSTAADVSAGVGIVAVSTAIGTLIPIPGVGTAVGFVVGVGLSYAYENWGKAAWHSTVDAAGSWLQSNVPKAAGAVADFGRSVARGAGDFVNSIGSGISSLGGSMRSGIGSLGSMLGF